MRRTPISPVSGGMAASLPSVEERVGGWSVAVIVMVEMGELEEVFVGGCCLRVFVVVGVLLVQGLSPRQYPLAVISNRPSQSKGNPLLKYPSLPL